MYLTKENLAEIEEWLRQRVNTPVTGELRGDDLIPLTRDGRRASVRFRDLSAQAASLYAPDEEDITALSTQRGLRLRFRDKTWDPARMSGKGLTYLRLRRSTPPPREVSSDDMTAKILSPGALYQKDFERKETAYVIRNDHDLGDKDIKIPEGCVLVFAGGTLSNGNITMDGTVIYGLTRLSDAGMNVTFSGTFMDGQVMAFIDMGYETNSGMYNNNKTALDKPDIRYWNGSEWEKLSLQDEVDVLEERMDVAETDIDSLETRMDTAESDIDSLETRMDTAESDVDALETRMDTAETNITNIETNIDEVETNITNIETNIDEIEENITNITTNVTNITQSLEGEYVASAAYDSDSKEINLYASDGETVLSTIDATAFIKDGMVNSVALVTENADGDTGIYLKITFNTDAGADDIYIDFTELLSTLTGGDGIIIDGTTVSVDSSYIYALLTGSATDDTSSGDTTTSYTLETYVTNVINEEYVSQYAYAYGMTAEYSSGLLVATFMESEQGSDDVTTGDSVGIYTPYATASQYGVVKVGDGISVSDGVISVNDNYVESVVDYDYIKSLVAEMISADDVTAYTLPVATKTTLGGVMIGDGISVTSTGVISVNDSYVTSLIDEEYVYNLLFDGSSSTLTWTEFD